MASTSDGNPHELMEISSEVPEKSGKRKYDEQELLASLQTLSEEQIQEIIGIAKKNPLLISHITKTIQSK